MAVDRAQKITQLRKDFVEAEKEKAGLESKLESLQKQKADAISECKAIGVDPAGIDARINEARAKIDEIILKMDAIKSGNATEQLV